MDRSNAKLPQTEDNLWSYLGSLIYGSKSFPYGTGEKIRHTETFIIKLHFCYCC